VKNPFVNYHLAMLVNFCEPFQAGSEINYIADVLSTGKSAGGGIHAKWCAKWLEENTGAKKAFLTNSATDALEMAALLLNFEPGDEVIMPSFTFSSTANAFVLRGAVPVFVDVDAETMNINLGLIEDAITNRTKAILAVHYAGASCDMRLLQRICKERGLILIEDAAQALLSKYDDQPLGSFGDLSCISFHATKNIISGEGGALLVNDEALIQRAKVILEKGTNREKFIAGEVDKYSWVDIGSSYLMSEIAAAYLHAQLENALEITETRLGYWKDYRLMLQSIKFELKLDWQEYSPSIHHNAHVYYLILPSEEFKKRFISKMRECEVVCASHYVPLHSAEAGLKFGRTGSQMTVTDSFASRLVRLPMWSKPNMPVQQISKAVISICREISQS